MGYDINIKYNGERYDHIYMTYNHSKLFEKYSIYPRDFNGMKVVDIIPHYEKAKKVLESAGHKGDVHTNASTAYKYNDNSLYQANDNVILYVVNDTLAVLRSCPGDATWHSD
jgi:hypothetical protein